MIEVITNSELSRIIIHIVFTKHFPSCFLLITLSSYGSVMINICNNLNLEVSYDNEDNYQSSGSPTIETLDKVQIDERMKLIRQEAQMTQSEAASALGISRRHYQSLEHGDYLIKTSVIEQIEETFNVGRTGCFMAMKLLKRIQSPEKFKISFQ